MLDNEKLRERLSAITRARRASAQAPPVCGAGSASRGGSPEFPAHKVTPPKSDARTGVEGFLPGGEWRGDRGTVFVHERLRSDIEKPRAHWGRLGDPPAGEPDLAALAVAGIGGALFLDLETGGLSSSPVFLAGTMHWNGETFVLRQYFARHYGEEAALLAAVAEQVRGFEYLVTYNGKSFDAPFLKGRAVVHGVPLALPPRHVDLLHIARRRWRDELPDCRLQTLERHVCRRFRSGDVPSDEVPGLYHDFVRDGDPWRLIPVFHHNLLDVLTMGEILQELCGGTGSRRRGRVP
ncbi:MAG: ribonuclease H-like domain-containing protein [Candidatus Eisenbacteria bacterium]